MFFIGVFVSRFLIEYVKNVQVGKEVEMIAEYGINMGQLLSVPLFVLGVFLMIYTQKSAKNSVNLENNN